MVYPKRKRSAGKSKQGEHSASAPLHGSEAKQVPVEKDTFAEAPSTEVLETVEDYAIISLDAAGIITTWNRGVEKIQGYTSTDINTKHYRILFTKEDRATGLAEKLLLEAKKNGKTNYDCWLVRKDGSRFWGSISLTAHYSAEGGVSSFLNIIQDLTDKKMADDKYSNFVEELKLKNESLKKSEERYHKMLSEILDYAIILLDKDGKILDWNKGAAKLKGYQAEEIVGKSFRLLYPKEEKDCNLPERLLAEAEEKGTVTHEGWRLRKNGTRFWGYVSITALRDSAGNIIGFSKITRDLTDKKIAEDKVSNVLEELRQTNEQLRLSEERYHKMIEEIQDYAIILLNIKGDIENWNTGAEFIKGYKAKEIIGKNFKVFYTEEDRQNELPETLLEQAREKGKITHEGWRVRKDGTRFWGSVVITSLHDTEGKLIGFSKITRDLTEKKQAEDALKASAAQLDLKNKTLERLNEELSSFTYVASHDLKEPLRKIQAFTTRIVDVEYVPEKSKEFIEKIRNTAARMQNLIDDLLSYSQVSNHDNRVQNIDLNEILQTAKNDLEVIINEKGAVIESDRLPVIAGVQYQFHQLFLNLISNSLKFSKENVNPVIRIRSRVIKGPEIPMEGTTGNNNYYHLSITDNGIGFSQENSTRIFEAFQRLHPNHIFAGTGIGLAIVKKVVENHNGIITAESHPGEGATFHLYLPVN